MLRTRGENYDRQGSSWNWNQDPRRIDRIDWKVVYQEHEKGSEDKELTYLCSIVDLALPLIASGKARILRTADCSPGTKPLPGSLKPRSPELSEINRLIQYVLHFLFEFFHCQ